MTGKSAHEGRSYARRERWILAPVCTGSGSAAGITVEVWGLIGEGAHEGRSYGKTGRSGMML